MNHEINEISNEIRPEIIQSGFKVFCSELYSKKRFALLKYQLDSEKLDNTQYDNIKFAELSMLDKLVSVWPDEFGSKSKEQVKLELAERFDKGYPCLVSEEKGIIQGYVWCIPFQSDFIDNIEDDAFEVCNLFVSSDCRNKGIGRKLLENALYYMSQKGKRAAYSRIFFERQFSLSLYRKVGFGIYGVMYSKNILGRQRNRFIPLSLVRRKDIKGLTLPACILLAQSAYGGTLEAIRSLGSKGVQVFVFVLNRDPKPYIKSRYCFYAGEIKNKDSKSICNELIEWSKSQNFTQSPLLLPMTDNLTTYVQENRKSLEDNFVIGSADSELVFNLLDKKRAVSLAESCGLAVPQTAVIKSEDDLKNASETMKFPTIAKPLWWREKGEFHRKTITIKKSEELVSKLSPFLNGNTSILIQELIEGEDHKVEIFMFYRDLYGQIWGCTGKKIRQSPPLAGIMATGKAVELPQLYELSCNFLNKINYHGLGGIEFKRDGSVLKYIETSARPENIHGLSRKAGIDLVWIAYCDYCLKSGGVEKPYKQHDAFYLDWHSFWTSYGKKNIFLWLINLLKFLCNQPLKIAIFELRDPKPSIYLAKRSFLNIFKKLTKGL